MRPSEYNLELYRGDTYDWVFRVWQDAAHTIPADLTGVVPRAQIRDSLGTLIMEPSCTLMLPNEVDMGIDDWSGVDVRQFANWDLQFEYPDGRIVTMVRGIVTFTMDVTV